MVVNKMDACGYKQERFEMLCVELSSQMKKLNLAPEQVRAGRDRAQAAGGSG